MKRITILVHASLPCLLVLILGLLNGNALGSIPLLVFPILATFVLFQVNYSNYIVGALYVAIGVFCGLLPFAEPNTARIALLTLYFLPVGLWLFVDKEFREYKIREKKAAWGVTGVVAAFSWVWGLNQDHISFWPFIGLIVAGILIYCYFEKTKLKDSETTEPRERESLDSLLKRVEESKKERANQSR
jgi:hypothetical protein